MAHVSIIALFCEDIREEKSGVNTLIGILPDNVNMPNIPGAFPKLGLYVRAHIDLDLKPNVTDLILSFKFPNGAEQEINRIPRNDILREMENVKGGGTYVGFVMAIIAGSFAIPAAGIIQVVAQFAGEEHICGRMNVEALGSVQQSEDES